MDLVKRALLLGAVALLPAARGQEPYRRPPDEVVRLVEAPLPPRGLLDPTGKVLLLVEREGLPPIKDLARPMLRLAGLRIDARRPAPHGPRRYTGLRFLRVDDRREVPVTGLPDDADLALPLWAPDGARVAFTLAREDGVELWVADAATGKARALTGPVVMAAGRAPVQWLSNSRLLCRLVPADRGPAPARPEVPAGPVTRETSGKAAPARTYQDLLQDEHDMALFEHLLTCQLAAFDLAGGRVDLGPPALYTLVEPSPDGRLLLVGRTERPFSTLVPWGSFPERVEVRSAKDGALVREVARVPLREDVPIEGVEQGPRRFGWQETAPDVLTWVEALDGGDPKKEVPHRDRVMLWPAPFEGEAQELLRLEHRFSGLSWLERGEGEAARALVSEYDRDRRWSRTWLVALDGVGLAGAPRKVWDRSIRDRYGHPGAPLTRTRPDGREVVRVHEGALLLSGRGSTPAGDRPFLDRLDLATLEATRLWRCAEDCYEDVVDLLAPDASRVLTVRETPTSPPNYGVRAGGERAALTAFADPQPSLRGVKKELVTYARPDGVPLSGTLYTPAGWTPAQGRLPLLVWAYPQEFNDPATAGQVSGSPLRFTRLWGASHLFLVTQGWAVLDGAAMPVVGDPETVNDTFVEQIVAAAKAAIDHVAGLGVADPARVAVGGHSYGAFMTANLLAHCDLFRAGLARSGAYNRTLTPFGFQGERRTLWEARDTYARLSPFTWADRIKAPLLLVHGEVDPNPGTFPLQSERLFHAIQGHGGAARLVLLPHEGHGYQARESVLHVLAETIDWFDRHVKAPR